MPLIPDTAGAAPDRPHRRSNPTVDTLGRLAALAARVVLLVILLALPWAFGGYPVEFQVWAFAGICLVLVWWMIALLAHRARYIVLPWAMLPLISATIFGALQLAPISSGVVQSLSPVTADLRAELQSERASSEVDALQMEAPPPLQTLSLYPAATRQDLALLCLAVTVFVLGAGLFSCPYAGMWLCSLMAANGALLAFFGLIQRITWEGKLYGIVPLPHGGPFGPFVNQNNAGGYLCLSLAGALGVAVFAMERRRHDTKDLTDSPATQRQAFLAWLWQHLLDSCSRLDAVMLTLFSVCGCVLTGIICSLSRGAWVAATAAAAVTIVLVLAARRRTSRAWWAAGAVILGLALISWLGLSETVHARFATLMDREEMTEHSLLAHWPASLSAAADFWSTGSGLGTYHHVYGAYETEAIDRWFRHAENQYLEALVVGGIVGLGLMLTMIVLLAFACWRLLRHSDDDRSIAFGVAGVFALTAQSVHALFDFGLFVPANALMFALLCGAIAGRASHVGRSRRRPSGDASTHGRFRCLPPGIALLLTATTLWGLSETRRAAAVQEAMRAVDISRLEELPDEELLHTVEDGMERLATALVQRPDDAEGQLRMAELAILKYRLEMLDEFIETQRLERLADPRMPQFGRDQLWELTSPMSFHEMAAADIDLRELRSRPLPAKHLPGVLKLAVRARRDCPLLPNSHLILAQLCGMLTDPGEDQLHIQRTLRVAPASPDLLYLCGQLDLHAGRFDLMCERWRSSLALSDRYLNDILQVAEEALAEPGMIERLLPESPAMLVRLARDRYATEEWLTVRGLLVDRAALLLEELDLPEAEWCYLRGSVLSMQGFCSEATESLGRAVALRPNEADWRYDYAVLLMQQGRLAEAKRQARHGARLAPRSRKHRQILERIIEAGLGQENN